MLVVCLIKSSVFPVGIDFQLIYCRNHKGWALVSSSDARLLLGKTAGLLLMLQSAVQASFWICPECTNFWILVRVFTGPNALQ